MYAKHADPVLLSLGLSNREISALQYVVDNDMEIGKSYNRFKLDFLVRRAGEPRMEQEKIDRFFNLYETQGFAKKSRRQDGGWAVVKRPLSESLTKNEGVIYSHMLQTGEAIENLEVVARALEIQPRYLKSSLDSLVDKGYLWRLTVFKGGEPAPIYRVKIKKKGVAPTGFEPVSSAPEADVLLAAKRLGH